MGSRRWVACFSMVLGMLALVMVLGLMGALGRGLDVAQAQPVVGGLSSNPVAVTDVTTRYVSSVTGDDDNNDCTDDTAPCQTIQHAVDQANDGDVVLIAALDNSQEAVYTGGGGEEIQNVVEVTKSLTLRGGYAYAHFDTPPVNTWTPDAGLSTVNGENQRRAIHISGNVTVTLRMLAFVNGQTANQGGNVYAEDALVRFVATPVLSGSAQYGGGLYLKNCRTAFDPGDLSDGEFDFGFDLGFGLDDDLLDQLGVSGLLLVRDNKASQDGGGIYVDGGAPVMLGLAVVSNTATVDGGGLYLKGGRPVFAGGLVLSNQAAYRGGGFFLGDSAARIAGAAVYSNTAANGAGFYLDGPIAFSESTVPIIANNYVRYNHTTASRGGGFYFHKAIAGLVNNVVADNVSNEGAGMYLYASSPQVFHTTLAQNTGGGRGIYVTNQPAQPGWPPAPPIPSLPSFTNTIIVSHSVGLYVETTDFPAPLENKVTLQGTLWRGNGTDTDGPGAVVQSTDVYSAPRFICTGDWSQCIAPYHVMTDSAAVDAGVDVALSIPGADLFVDIDGQMRPANQAYDIGADEVVTRAFDLWFMPPAAYQMIEPGKTFTYVHWLINTGLQTDTYDLDFLSSETWAELLNERTITLTPRTSETVRVRVTAPETATAQLQEISIVTATSQGDAERRGRVIDVTDVFTGERTDVQVNKWAEVDEVKSGEVVNFTVVITNAGPLTGTLAVTLTDRVAPLEEAVTGLSAPDDLDDCASDPDQGLVTCTLTLTGTTLPVTRVVNIKVSTSENYTGVLHNTAVVRSAARDENSQNNRDEAAVSIVAKPSCVPIDHVTIDGYSRVLSGTLAAFKATISPSDATTPTFYAWEPADYVGSVVLPGHSIVTYTWHTTGTKTITVTATNCDGDGNETADKEVKVHVKGEGGEGKIYLPLVLRNG